MQVYVIDKTLSDGSEAYELCIRQGSQHIRMPLAVRTWQEAEAVAYGVAKTIISKTMETVRLG